MLGWQRRGGFDSLLFVENPMSLQKLSATLMNDVARLREEGRAKAPERVTVDYVAPSGKRGDRRLYSCRCSQ